MAKRPSVKEILEAARRGGPATPAGEESPPAAEAASSQPATPAPARPASKPAAPAANAPTPSQLGRPLTVKEKLAAARAGAGGAALAAAAAPAAADEPEAAAPTAPAAPVDIPTPEKLGRPLTVKEKLAAARANASAAAPAAGGAKPAAAKPAAAKAAPKKELPPLSEISDPKDLAEALRQAATKKEQEEAAARAKAAPAKPAKEKEKKPESVLPRPGRGAAATPAAGATAETRRSFWLSAAALLWLAWGSFTFGVTTFTVMLVRFMFPNVLAEPPSTIKIGLPNSYESEAVNERFKAEWGFWVVRSTRYDGQDIIYALKSVCTHLGCPPNWLAGEQKFKCPCHGSGFYISGVNFEGPAPRPLERFKVTVADDGQILVDKSQIFQQELGQWSDPDSFVTA